MPVSVVVSHHPASIKARKMIGAATVSTPRGLFRDATTYFPTPGVRAAQQTHACASCTPPIRTVTVGAGISPAQPPSFGEGGSRTITAGSDFHRPRSTRQPLCHVHPSRATRARRTRAGRGLGLVPLIRTGVRSMRMSVSEFAQRLDLAVGVLRAENRGTRDKVVGTRHRCALDGRARDPAVHLNRDLQAGGVDGRRVRSIFGIICSMKDWPPKPGSTVMIRIMSNSLRISTKGAMSVAGLSARPARAPRRCSSRARRSGAAAASAWKVTEWHPTSA